MKLYIAILDEFPDYMTPTLVAHAMLNAHMKFWYEHAARHNNYVKWLQDSFKKCVVRVNQKEFDRICSIEGAVVQHEKHTLEGRNACVIVPPVPDDELPNVLKFAKLWKPKETITTLQQVVHVHPYEPPTNTYESTL